MNNFLQIKDKHFLVTGASGGIGSACAKLLCDFGAQVTLTGRNQEKLEIIAKALKNEPRIIATDISNSDEINQLVKSCEPIDGLVNCAGIIKPMPIKFFQEKHFDEVIGVNLKSALLLTSQLLKQKKIKNNSSMIYISSISSSFPYLGGGLYVTSKGGLESFVKTLALEHHKILRANIISPGLVKTEIFETTMEATGEDEMKQYEEKYPLGFGSPEDIANAVGFLVSERSKWITGENLIMDGGLTIGSK
jgi:NAD(P)-dependent dehydrogenase (short-subunit alcohol dehydrogenase family)